MIQLAVVCACAIRTLHRNHICPLETLYYQFCLSFTATANCTLHITIHNSFFQVYLSVPSAQTGHKEIIF